MARGRVAKRWIAAALAAIAAIGLFVTLLVSGSADSGGAGVADAFDPPPTETGEVAGAGTPEDPAPPTPDTGEAAGAGTPEDPAPPTPDTTADASGYFAFDGVDDYLNLGTNDVSGSQLTIEAWFNFDEYGTCASADCRIVSKASGTAEQDHYWMLSTIDVEGETRTRFRLKTDGETSTLIATAGELRPNQWYHVAGTYDGQMMQLFVDGMQVGAQPKTGEIAGNETIEAWIGGNPSGSTDRPWSGAIDEVRIWTEARSEEQLREWSARDLEGPLPQLVAHYRFHESGPMLDGGEWGSIPDNTESDSRPVFLARDRDEVPTSPPADATTQDAESAPADATERAADPSLFSSVPQGPIASSWEEAAASSEIAVIRDWYLARTGFSAFYSDELGRTLELSDLERMDALTITDDDVVIEGAYITGPVTILGDNVTIRASVIDIRGYTYGVHVAGAAAGSNWTIEYVSFVNTAFEESRDHRDRANRPIYTSTSGAARFNQTLDGYSTGYYSVNSSDQVWEYNFTDRIVRSPGSHNTGLNIRTFGSKPSGISNIRVYRNLLLDGTSAPLALYTDTSGLHSNILFQENIMDMPYASDTWYCLYTSTDRGNDPQFSNIRWIGNIFGTSAHPTCGRGGPFTGAQGDVWSDNRYIDGTPID